jgi:hypothetical protein
MGLRPHLSNVDNGKKLRLVSGCKEKIEEQFTCERDIQDILGEQKRGNVNGTCQKEPSLRDRGRQQCHSARKTNRYARNDTPRYEHTTAPKYE